jgi:hypothetical protein
VKNWDIPAYHTVSVGKEGPIYYGILRNMLSHESGYKYEDLII